MAGRIPKSFIDDLLSRVDIVDVIDARVPLKKAGKDYKACCPFHEEKTASFTVSPTKQFYHCFGCGAHGTAVGFVMDYEHVTFPEAVETLAAHAGLKVPYEGGAPAAKENGTDLYAILTDAAGYYRSQLREHAQATGAITYLKNRGLTGETAKKFELGFAPPGWDNLVRALGKDDAALKAMATAGLLVAKERGGYYDRFRERIIFPIHDARGRIIGFGGRVMGKDEPKYLNSPETPLFHKGRELYGLARAREAIHRANRVLLVEGYMDVIALDQSGVEYAVATLGTAATKDHFERLWRLAPEVVCCFDGDRAGRDAAWRALETALPLLREGRELSFLFLPDGEDPDSLVRKEGRPAFEERLRSAKPFPDFFFDSLARQVDLGRLDGRARLVELARPLLSRMPAGVLRQMMLDRLAERAQIQPNQLSHLVQPTAAPGPTAPSRSSNSPGGPKEPPSSVRLAVAILIQHPEVATVARDFPQLSQSQLPGIELLREVLSAIGNREQMTAATLVEHFRDTDNAANVMRLAAFSHPALEQNDLVGEFRGLLEQIRRQDAKSRADRLLAEQKSRGLNATEKAELARLLAEKHGIGQISGEH